MIHAVTLAVIQKNILNFSKITRQKKKQRDQERIKRDRFSKLCKQDQMS